MKVIYASTLRLLVFLAVLCCLGAKTLLAAPPIAAVAFTPNGDQVLVGSQSGLALYSWPKLERLPQKIATDLERVHDIRFSPNGELLAVAGGEPHISGEVEIIDWKSRRRRNRYDVSEDVAYAVAWGAESESLLCGCSMNHLSWIDLNQASVGRVPGHSKSVFAVSRIGDVELGWLSGGDDRSLRRWPGPVDQLPETIGPLKTWNNHTGAVVAIELRPNHEGLPMVATAARDGTVRLWQPTIGRLVRFARLASPPLAICWTTDGAKIAAACGDGRVRVIDPDTVEVVAERKAVDGWAYCIAAAPKGGFVVGGSNGQLRRVTLER